MKIEQLKINGWNRQEESSLRVGKDGLIKEDRVIKDNEIIDIKDRRKNLTAQQRYFLNKSNDFKRHCDSLGGYIHMIYAKNEILFNKLEIDKANISRIIYLATYMDYNDRKEGLLCVRSQHSKLEPMDKKTMQNILKLGDTAFKKFLKDMKDNELMYEVDKKFYVNPIYFNRGDIDKDVKKSVDKSYCRLFIKPIRDLYEGCKTSKHKVLASIYQLIPYIHLRTNALCLNPSEITKEPQKMDSKTLCDILNIGTDKGQRSRFIKDLYSFKVDIENKTYKLFSYVKIISDNRDFYVVNPYVIYMGNDVDYVKKVAKDYFFKK